MNVSTLVHDLRQTSKFRSKAPSQRHVTVYHPRGLEKYERDMASALTASPYSSQAPAFARTPQLPPSPPAEDPNAKCTLPSIQSLIGMADEPATTDLEPQRKSFCPGGTGVETAMPPLTCHSQRKPKDPSLNRNFKAIPSRPPIFDRRIKVIPA